MEIIILKILKGKTIAGIIKTTEVTIPGATTGVGITTSKTEMAIITTIAIIIQAAIITLEIIIIAAKITIEATVIRIGVAITMVITDRIIIGEAITTQLIMSLIIMICSRTLHSRTYLIAKI